MVYRVICNQRDGHATNSGLRWLEIPTGPHVLGDVSCFKPCKMPETTPEKLQLTSMNYPGKRPQTVFKGPFMKLFKDAGFTKLLLLNVSCQTYPPPKLQTPLFFSTAKIEIGRCREAADLCMQKRITWRHAGAWQHVQLA